MGTVVQFKRKKKKELPRGPRGKVLLRVGQTWVHNPYETKVVIRKLGVDKNGRPRVWFSKKYSKLPYWDEVSEATFRMNYFEESEWVKFSNETWAHLRAHLDQEKAHPGWYRFFDITPPGKALKAVPEPLPPQPLPKKGEKWKSVSKGYVVEILSTSYNEGLRIQYKCEAIGLKWASAEYLDSFKGKFVRVQAAA